jgi:hypothetical protein
MTYNFAQDGSYDLIIVLSTDGATALDEIAPQYPIRSSLWWTTLPTTPTCATF